MYDNEREAGHAVLDFVSSKANTASLQREDIFFTSKLYPLTTYGKAREAIRQSVKRCGLGFVDLLLLHAPYGGKERRLACWKAVEDAIADGEVRIGGVRLACDPISLRQWGLLTANKAITVSNT